MIQSLKCPSCSAPVEYEEDSEKQTIRCPFCNNTMYVPDMLRQGRLPRAFSFKLTPRAQGEIRRWSLLVVLGIITVSVLFFGLIAFIVYFSIPSRTTTQTVPRPPALKPSGLKPQPTAGSGFATVALKFGSEGIGPGTFTDARSIAVDEAGHIYVGEYTGGRIQVFDATGKFITQWTVNTEMPLRGMAADRGGTLYVVQSGKITRYEGTSGKQLGVVPYAEGSDFDDVVVTADNGLIAAWNGHRDDIVRFDAGGSTIQTIRSAISGQSRRSELSMRVAVDGMNNIYALGRFNDAVFKFAPDGRFVTRFGGSGDQPGQFRAPYAITVDNQGRIYVGDIKGIQVFDAEGRYLDLFKPEGGSVSGMDFNDKNELFVVARTQVLKFVINRP